MLEIPLCYLDRKAPTFELADPAGDQYDLDRLMGEKGWRIGHICSHRSYVKAIFARLVADAKELQTIGVNVVAMVPNDFRFYANASLQYCGRIEDSLMEDKAHRNKELLEAMRLVAQAGKEPWQQTIAMGCSIQWQD